MRSLPLALGALGLVLLQVLAVEPATAQGRFGDEETRLIRQAADLESAGDLEGAEETLRRLLQIDPVSTGAIYALERVLRQRGGVAPLRPFVDGFLSRRQDSGIRSLKLQLLVEADSLDALVQEAEWWMARSPDDETPYTEIARAYELAFGHERALEVLEAGRARIGGDALALAIGDHYAAGGDVDAAVDEWARAIGPGGSSLQAVRRRIESLAEGETAAARRLVRALGSSGVSARRRTGVSLAIELGLGPEALAMAQREAETVSGSDRSAYLQEVAVAATAAGVAEVASWAYAELGRTERDPEGRRLIEQRRAEASLAAGDTVGALDAFESVASSMPTGAPDRRLVEARAIRIAAQAAEIDRLRTYWSAFREAYPESGELDPLAATTAAALVAWGDVQGAVAVLDGIRGPRSAIERAYLLMAGGEVEVGRDVLMEAVDGLPPSEATDVIQMVALLGRVSGDGARVLAAAGVQEHLGRGAAGAQTLADEAFGLPEGDRAALLAEAGRIAERAGDAAGAADIRRRLVREYPGAPEVGEASLALARYMARVEGNVEEAARLLEDLITGQPNAAVVPEARLELERLGRPS